MIMQLSFIPDVDPTIKRESVPLVQYIGGRWCWLVSGTDEYRHEPDLERILLAALARRRQRKAA